MRRPERLTQRGCHPVTADRSRELVGEVGDKRSRALDLARSPDHASGSITFMNGSWSCRKLGRMEPTDLKSNRSALLPGGQMALDDPE
jgi:hypothetical protein